MNQNAGGSQGNPNYVYYKLAAQGSPVFHSITRGDIAVNCGGTENCFGATTSSNTGIGRRTSQSVNGALSVSTSSYSPAYGAAASWNFATGIGSLDAYQLVNNWAAGQ